MSNVRMRLLKFLGHILYEDVLLEKVKDDKREKYQELNIRILY